MTTLLETLGWGPRLAGHFAEHAEQGLVPGRVALEHNHIYRVLTDEGERLAEASGRLKHRAGGQHELPVVGDWVGLDLVGAGQRAAIHAILPRQSAFSRKVAGRVTREQVIAANIDVVFLVEALDQPPNLRRLERYLLLARRSGAQPVFLLNKVDLSGDPGQAIQDVRTLAGDVPVLAVSAATGERFEDLNTYLQRGRTVALLGPSGVGKSSIVNRLVGRELIATAEVRASDKRGRHTSVHRHLVPLGDAGLIIDTPGMRELQLWESDERVDDTFEDIRALAPQCRFRNCRHDQEPGCAVKAAVADGRIPQGRYDSYLKLESEQNELARKQAERDLQEHARKSKQRPRGR